VDFSFNNRISDIDDSQFRNIQEFRSCLQNDGVGLDEFVIDALVKSQEKSFVFFLNDKTLPSEFLISFLGPRFILQLKRFKEIPEADCHDKMFFDRIIDLLETINFNSFPRLFHYSPTFIKIQKALACEKSEMGMSLKFTINNFINFVIIYQMEWNRCSTEECNDLGDFVLELISLDAAIDGVDLDSQPKHWKTYTKILKNEILAELCLKYPKELDQYKSVFEIKKLLKI
jgi:hypothetical protein